MRMVRTSWIDLAGATAVADPALDLKVPLKGPFRTLPLSPHEHAEAALRLARLAGLLPALFIGGGGGEDVRVSADAIMAAAQSVKLRVAKLGALPGVREIGVLIERDAGTPRPGARS